MQRAVAAFLVVLLCFAGHASADIPPCLRRFTEGLLRENLNFGEITYVWRRVGEYTTPDARRGVTLLLDARFGDSADDGGRRLYEALANFHKGRNGVALPPGITSDEELFAAVGEIVRKQGPPDSLPGFNTKIRSLGSGELEGGEKVAQGAAFDISVAREAARSGEFAGFEYVDELNGVKRFYDVRTATKLVEDKSNTVRYAIDDQELVSAPMNAEGKFVYQDEVLTKLADEWSRSLYLEGQRAGSFDRLVVNFRAEPMAAQADQIKRILINQCDSDWLIARLGGGDAGREAASALKDVLRSQIDDIVRFR